MHKRFRHLCLALAALIAAGTLLAALIPAAEAATFPQGKVRGSRKEFLKCYSFTPTLF